MTGSHHPLLVGVSIAIAMLASYTALQLAGRVSAAAGWVRLAWLASGSVAMGVGIWSMHFVAMLALRLPVPIVYDVPIWLLSVAIAILASLLALFVVSRAEVRLPTMLTGGLLMGAAIAGMHYTGMAAVRIPGRIEYDPLLVALSVGIAIACAFVALFLARYFRSAQTRQAAWAMAGSGVVMGLAIAGLHYTAMAAARFIILPQLEGVHQPGLLASAELTVSVVIGTVLILGLALLGSLMDRRLRIRDAEAAALRESRRAMATLLGNLPGMAYRCRPDARRRLEFASDGVLELTGYPAVDVARDRGLAFADLIHPADLATVQQEVHRALQEDRPFQLAYRIHTAAGGERWVSEQGQGVFSSDGEVLALEGFVTDITERRRSSELDRQLATIVESTSDAIVSMALDGTILTWNRGAEQIYGYAADEVLGGSISLLQPAELEQEEADLTTWIDRGETVTHLETVRLRKGGQPVHVALTLSPIYDASGAVLGASGISRDITAQKRAEEELRRARDEAEAANRAKSDFLASMSHELRTPLNSVIGFANILLKNKAGNLRHQDLQYLERIVGSGRHLLRLINDVLDLSKIEAGKVDIDLAPLSLNALITETVAELHASVRDGVTLQAAMPEPPIFINSDAQKLKQVLINLLGNALKFTEQGMVTVAVVRDPALHRPRRIEVRDTGIGIPAERLTSIFQPFEQAESGTARRFGGTGLGLPISASLCQLLGYRLEVSSTPGAGSTFAIVFAEDEHATVPMANTEVTREHVIPAAHEVQLLEPEAWQAELQRKQVLIIDDDEDARQILSHHLLDFGCDVLLAASGEEGLRLAREQRPQLIVLDLLMPGMNGWEVLRELREDPELQETPVVVVSGLADRGWTDVLGVVDLLAKPVDPQQMARVLRRNLGPQRKRVLVVDDDENARLLVSACLQDENIEIRTAANGREGLRVLETFTPDVVVLDLLMPELDGLGFLARLRRELPHWAPSVIVVTGKDLSRAELQRLSENTRAVLRKDGELESELKRILDGLWDALPAESAGADAARSAA